MDPASVRVSPAMVERLRARGHGALKGDASRGAREVLQRTAVQWRRCARPAEVDRQQVPAPEQLAVHNAVPTSDRTDRGISRAPLDWEHRAPRGLLRVGGRIPAISDRDPRSARDLMIQRHRSIPQYDSGAAPHLVSVSMPSRNLDADRCARGARDPVSNPTPERQVLQEQQCPGHHHNDQCQVETDSAVDHTFVPHSGTRSFRGRPPRTRPTKTRTLRSAPRTIRPHNPS